MDYSFFAPKAQQNSHPQRGRDGGEKAEQIFHTANYNPWNSENQMLIWVMTRNGFDLP